MLEWMEGAGSLLTAIGILGMLYVKVIRRPAPVDHVGALTMILSFSLFLAGVTVMVMPGLYLLFN